ncbi:MAG TPA: carbohydate-binding domain-containing protein, partial [Duganella sp.]|nr:carbohydate-binding domain-containing protein [Duganella sp.]
MKSTRMKIVAALLLSFGALAAQAAPEQIKMRWEVLRNEVTAQGERSRARLSVTALRGQSLPAQGWSLYFNCMEGVVTGPLAGHLVLEQVVGGSLFRVRPIAGFKGLPAGRTLNIDYYYPNLAIKLSRAPVGPY